MRADEQFMVQVFGAQTVTSVHGVPRPTPQPTGMATPLKQKRHGKQLLKALDSQAAALRVLQAQCKGKRSKSRFHELIGQAMHETCLARSVEMLQDSSRASAEDQLLERLLDRLNMVRAFPDRRSQPRVEPRENNTTTLLIMTWIPTGRTKHGARVAMTNLETQ